MPSDNVTSIDSAKSPQSLRNPKVRRREPAAPKSLSTHFEPALDEQRYLCWEAAAIIESVALAMRTHFFQGDWPAGTPEFHRALHMAARTISNVADALEVPCIEDRAKQIAAENARTVSA